MSNEARLNDVSVEAIPEVRAFEEAKNRLEAFKAGNPVFFKYLDELSTDFNDKLEAAEKAVRAKQVSCGSFQFYQTATKYDAARMHDTLGRDRFLNMGGGTRVIEEKIIDRARVETNVKSGAITEQEASQFVTVQARYKMPDKIVLP